MQTPIYPDYEKILQIMLNANVANAKRTGQASNFTFLTNYAKVFDAFQNDHNFSHAPIAHIEIAEEKELFDTFKAALGNQSPQAKEFVKNVVFISQFMRELTPTEFVQRLFQRNLFRGFISSDKLRYDVLMSRAPIHSTMTIDWTDAIRKHTSFTPEQIYNLMRVYNKKFDAKKDVLKYQDFATLADLVDAINVKHDKESLALIPRAIEKAHNQIIELARNATVTEDEINQVRFQILNNIDWIKKKMPIVYANIAEQLPEPVKFIGDVQGLPEYFKQLRTNARTNLIFAMQMEIDDQAETIAKQSKNIETLNGDLQTAQQQKQDAIQAKETAQAELRTTRNNLNYLAGWATGMRPGLFSSNVIATRKLAQTLQR